MSRSSLRLIRAVRLLPEAVKIGSKIDKKKDVIDDLTESSQIDSEKEQLNKKLEERNMTCKDLQRELSELRDRHSLLEKDLRSREKSWQEEKTRILAQVEEEKTLAHKEGKTRGYEEGFQQGSKDGRDELYQSIKGELEGEVSDVVKLLNEVHNKLLANLEELVASNPYRLVRLWQKVLSRILVREVAFDQDSALRVLRELLARASEKEDVRVFLNPDDLSYVESRTGTLGDIVRTIKNIEFLPDEEVDRGSCIVETGLGIYDARWRTQLEQIATEVEGVLLEGSIDES